MPVGAAKKAGNRSREQQVCYPTAGLRASYSWAGFSGATADLRHLIHYQANGLVAAVARAYVPVALDALAQTPGVVSALYYVHTPP